MIDWSFEQDSFWPYFQTVLKYHIDQLLSNNIRLYDLGLISSVLKERKRSNEGLEGDLPQSNGLSIIYLVSDWLKINYILWLAGFILWRNLKFVAHVIEWYNSWSTPVGLLIYFSRDSSRCGSQLRYFIAKVLMILRKMLNFSRIINLNSLSRFLGFLKFQGSFRPYRNIELKLPNGLSDWLVLNFKFLEKDIEWYNSLSTPSLGLNRRKSTFACRDVLCPFLIQRIRV